jgi:hypothetical protein
LYQNFRPQEPDKRLPDAFQAYFSVSVLCIGVWFGNGFSFHQYITFFFFCSLSGYLFFGLAECTQNRYALRSLIEHPDIFNRAIAEQRIMIVRKGAAQSV